METVSEENGVVIIKKNYCNYEIISRKNAPLENKINSIKWVIDNFIDRKPKFKLVKERKWHVLVKMRRKP